MASRAKSKAKTSKATANKAGVFDVITPPNVLKVKVGGAGAPFDEDAIARADAILQDLALNFREWLRDDIARLLDAYAAYQRTNGADPARTALHLAAHDLKGEAGTLGLPLIGRVAGSLAILLSEKQAPSSALLAEHVALIDSLFREGPASEATSLQAAEALESAVAAL